MKTAKRLIGAALALLLAYQGYVWVYYGMPYRERRYSPNQAFYYQKYRLFSWSRWIPRMTMPGDGDSSLYAIDGYLRVFKADGTLEGEGYDRCISVTEVFWTGRSLVGFGCTEHLIRLSADGG
ncbi:hypothetical protein J4P02_11820 [Pseudomonas sp. NFXW11]|uniref:hypothetical protein n=1 Tax=Pseudomonas sp. NFXW11 TaxID=2819531 RepID=UPI003CF7B576